MPKQTQVRTSARNTMPSLAPYPEAPQPPQKVAAIWSSSDDEILLQARASGLNWQPIANRYFPNKSANACRKRHERLVERRHGDDWDTHKLELLAAEYMACRKEMWEVLAARVGERWLVVEAKCMEKGFKTLQTTARLAQRKASAAYQPKEDRWVIPDHHSDSGIGFGSDAELDVAPGTSSREAVSWHARRAGREQTQLQSHQEHVRSRSLPQPLPLYQPPPPIPRTFEGRTTTKLPREPSPLPTPTVSAPRQRRSLDQNGRGGISIQSVLSS
ncbi:hypothetical protein SMMN14_00951 [Sphaerulina musiva]